MKKFFLVLGSVVLFMAVVRAQDTSVTKEKKPDSIQEQDRIDQEEYLIFKSGKLYWVQNGQRSEIKNQIILNNGTVLNPNGSYHLKIHDRYQLADGECLDIRGNRYRNEERFNQKRMINKADIEKSPEGHR